MSGKTHSFWVYSGQWTRGHKILKTMKVHNISLDDYITEFNGGHVSVDELRSLSERFKVSVD